MSESGAVSLGFVSVMLLAAGCSSWLHANPDAGADPATREESSPAQAPPDAPNVLVWMMDDVGFAQVSSFGGLVPTPNIDRVAEMGLR